MADLAQTHTQVHRSVVVHRASWGLKPYRILIDTVVIIIGEYLLQRLCWPVAGAGKNRFTAENSVRDCNVNLRHTEGGREL